MHATILAIALIALLLADRSEGLPNPASPSKTIPAIVDTDKGDRERAAAYARAVQKRVGAEAAVVHYVEVTFESEKRAIEEEIASTKADQETKQLFLMSELEKASRVLSPPKLVGFVLEVKKIQFRAENALVKRDILINITKEKTIKALQAEVAKHRVDELAQKLILESKLKEPALEQSQRARKAIELAIKEYSDTVFPAELSRLDAKVDAEKAALRLAQERLASTKAKPPSPYVDGNSNRLSDELAVKMQEYRLENVQQERTFLLKNVKTRVIDALQLELEIARAREKAAEPEFDDAKSKDGSHK